MSSPVAVCLSTAVVYWSIHYLLIMFLTKSRTLSRTDVADISTKVLSGIHASLASGGGLYIMLETFDDCLFSRSTAIVPFTYIGLSYMSCDLLAMYLTFCKTRDLSLYTTGNLFLFVRCRPLLVLHHIVLIACYPILVYDSLRKEMGDFLIGTLFIRELSSPLLSTAKILRRIGMKGWMVYQINGVVLVVTFFLVRILNTPLTLLLYSGQHHHWQLWKALSAMRPICHLLVGAEFFLQTYWFYQLLSTALLSASSSSSSLSSSYRKTKIK